MSRAPYVTLLRDPPTGLFAAVVVDRRIDGIAAGGIRVRSYPDEASAIRDAEGLARAMTLKAALAGVPCGGAKTVVRLDGLVDREGAMEVLGRHVEARNGALYVGPDFGFTEADRDAVARTTRYVDPAEIAREMADATALGVREALAAALGADRLAGRSIGVQGLGAVGGALARMLLAEGAIVSGCDVVPGRTAIEGLRAVGVEELASTELDALAPCALGGAIDGTLASRLSVRALAGAANNLLVPPEAEVARLLARRGIVHVPDFLANAGALVHWACRVLAVGTVEDARRAVLRIGDTAREVLDRSRRTGATPLEVAHALARERSG